jgi:carbonic anhydrase
MSQDLLRPVDMTRITLRPDNTETTMPTRPAPDTDLARLLLAGASAVLALALAPAAQAGGHAADPHSRPTAPAAASAAKETPPAAAAERASAPAPGTLNAAKPILTMDDLRQRLQDRISQVQARQATAQGTPQAAAPAAAAGSSRDLVLTVPPSGRAVAKASTAGGHGAEPASRGAARKPAAAGAHAPAHWGYGGEGGPAQWGSLKPEFATCANGSRQSPIDIRSGIRVDLEPIQFDYWPVAFQVVDNGHTVQANLSPGNAIVVGGKRYELVQFHFHRPSEEAINGRQFEMVAHLVHKDPEGRLAVVAVLMDQGRAHPMVQLVWNSLPLEQTETVQSPAPIDMNLMLPDDRRYFTYMGSLTTPPCSEGVRWLVLKQPATMSADQIAVFARLYPMNARPLQQASGRLIKESN